MYYVETVEIKDFWGDKTVKLSFNDSVNFLIGVNGSGKTTIINLISACLIADYATMKNTQFSSIQIILNSFNKDSVNRKYLSIEKENNRYYNSTLFRYKIKDRPKSKGTEYVLTEESDEEELYYRMNDVVMLDGKPIKSILKELLSVSWLSINRSSNFSPKRPGERTKISTIDRKISQLSNAFLKYSAGLNSLAAVETANFQEMIFLSLLKDDDREELFNYSKQVIIEDEIKALTDIYKSFNLNEVSFKTKIKKHFDAFKIAAKKVDADEKSFSLDDFSSLVTTKRIHSIILQWNILIEEQNKIYNSRDLFLSIINSLFQRKKLFVNDKNELLVETQSGKVLSLYKLSSGEKQLLIILCESLLQQNEPHIYIADEPELSLHIEWQERLVLSLKELNSNSQIIFATHSPDIVSSFNKDVIKIENCIYDAI